MASAPNDSSTSGYATEKNRASCVSFIQTEATWQRPVATSSWDARRPTRGRSGDIEVKQIRNSLYSVLGNDRDRPQCVDRRLRAEVNAKRRKTVGDGERPYCAD